jgi:hypothetical protein
MLRYILAALAVVVLLTASLIPDGAYARGGRGGGGGFRGGGGGFHGGGFRGGAHVGGIHGGAGRFHGGGYRYAGRGQHPSHPIAGRPIAGRPGRPIAGRPGRPIAAVGAYGAYGYYGGNACHYDNYGQWVCPQQYPY